MATAMSRRVAVRALARAGCSIKPEGGGHTKWICPMRSAQREHPQARLAFLGGGCRHHQADGLPAGRMASVKTYTARAKRWEHGWELHIDGVGVTQSHSLLEAEMMVRDYIALDLEVPTDSFNVEIEPELGDDPFTPEERAAAEAFAEAIRERARRLGSEEERP